MSRAAARPLVERNRRLSDLLRAFDTFRATYEEDQQAGILQGIQQGVQQGIQQGRLELLRADLLEFGSSRFGDPDAALVSLIQASDDADVLNRVWLGLIHQSLGSWDEVRTSLVKDQS